MDQEIKTVIQYPTGSTEFDIPFDYLSRKFVRVSLVSDDNRRLLSNITEYRYVSKTRVKLLAGTAGFDRVEIRRYTSASDRIVDFSDGSVLRATDLNVAQLQSSHIAEEARDAALMAMPQDDAGNLDARNRRIVRLAPGIAGTDAINKNQLDTTLGEAGGILSDVKEIQGEIYDYITKFADDTAMVKGVNWVYNSGVAIGGETVIKITKATPVFAVPYLEINGSRQFVGWQFSFNAITQEITLVKPLVAGDFVVALTTESHLPLEDLLYGTTGAGSIGTTSGETVQAVLDRLGDVESPEKYGATGGPDDSDAVQRAIDAAAARAKVYEGIITPEVVILLNMYRIKKTLTVDGSRVRLVSLTSAGGLHFDPTGSYDNLRCIVVNGTAPNAAYVGQLKGLADGVRFTSTGKTLTLFHAFRTSSNSGDNGACLHNINMCTFRGFKTVFTHGAGGWGWTFNSSQFSGNDTLMNLVTAADTYERHTFIGCTWQNGGYAFNMDNPDGKVYWIGGSIDYCDGLALISRGHLETSGHNEWTARTQPLVRITGDNASVVSSGAMFIRNNTTTPYVIFEQYKSRQVAVRDLTFVTDGVNVARGTLSNREVLKSNIFFANDTAKGIAYNSADEPILNGNRAAADITLSPSVNHTYTVQDSKITVTANAGGSSAHLYVDIFIGGSQKVALKMRCTNGSTTGPVFLNKSIMTAGKATIADLTSYGTTQWVAGASSDGGTVTVIDVPKQAAFLRLDFNLVNLTTATTFTIENLNLFTA